MFPATKPHKPLSMLRKSLDGVWSYHSLGDSEIRGIGRVPGCIHTDLLAEGQIKDPYYRDNEVELLWISEQDWCYEHSFSLEAEILDYSVCELICEGLDTLATISINGHTIGEADNMYRRWTYDLHPHLREGENTIQIVFKAAPPWLRAKLSNTLVSLQKVGAYEALPRAELRKEPCNFGWDWGPVLTTCGIWLPIYIQAHNGIQLDNILIQQLHDGDGVSLQVTPEITHHIDTAYDAEGLTTRLILSKDNIMLAESSVSCDEKHRIDVVKPELWWPAGMGEQVLYDIDVDLISTDGQVLQSLTRTIGLRTVELVLENDAVGQSFYFKVNGKPIFTKGSNWIPADSLPNNVSERKIRQLLQDAVDVNMNVIRVWGGGYYEPDIFYTICDELGLLVWQDFMFTCSTYPANNSDFMENIAQEASDNVKRLRHHACLCLWCGNNELEMYHTGDKWDATHMPWSDYDKLFNGLLPKLVRELSPDCNYWPGSPHSPSGNRLDYNNPCCGDAHIWDVWFHDKESTFHLDCTHRYISEFGFSSYAHPQTIKSFTKPSDRIVGSYVLEQHQRNRKGDGTILNYISKRFKLPTSFEKIVWLSQITQGDILREAIEHWRRLQPHTMGALYWQLNDCWPATSWSTLDYAGRWKASHYMTRRYFAPLLLSVKVLPDEGAFEVWLTQDIRNTISGTLVANAWHVSGKLLKTETMELEPQSILSSAIAKYENTAFLEYASRNELLIELVFKASDGLSAKALHHFSPIKHIRLTDPELKAKIELDPESTQLMITLSAKRPALFVFADVAQEELRASDNFVHIFPSTALTLHAHAQGRAIHEWYDVIEISHLYELCKSEEESISEGSRSVVSNCIGGVALLEDRVTQSEITKTT